MSRPAMLEILLGAGGINNLLKVLKTEQLHALVWVSVAQTWP